MTNCMEDAFKEAGVTPPKKVSVTLINESAMKLTQELIGPGKEIWARSTHTPGHGARIEIHFTEQPGHMLVLDARGIWHLKTEVTL